MNDYLAASNATSLLDMANGAIKERIDYEMGRVMQNIFNTPFNNSVLPYERSKCKPKSQDTTGHRTVLQ